MVNLASHSDLQWIDQGRQARLTVLRYIGEEIEKCLELLRTLQPETQWTAEVVVSIGVNNLLAELRGRLRNREYLAEAEKRS